MPVIRANSEPTPAQPDSQQPNIMNLMQPSLMLTQPLTPKDVYRLEDLALDMAAKANGLEYQLPLGVRRGLGDLVRSVNAYYSSLIVGHNTHPGDIDSALSNKGCFTDNAKKVLQHEAYAHIQIQRLIKQHQDLQVDTTSYRYLEWLHREFWQLIPGEFRLFRNSPMGEPVSVIPGTVKPDMSGVLSHLLDQFEKSYANKGLRKMYQIIILGVAHFRLLWMDPFIGNANKRIALLMTHASLQRCGMIGSGLWSEARGIERNKKKYLK